MINTIFIVLSLLNAVLYGILFVKRITLFFIPIIAFIGTYFLCIAILLIIIFIVSLTINDKKDYDKFNKFYHYFFAYVIQFICNVCRIKVVINGYEKIPKNKYFVLVQNHRSNFDPMITHSVLKHFPLSFLSKPENFDLFLVGKYMRANGYIGINRVNPKQAIPAVKRGANHILSENYCVAIYPEGTRNLKSNELLPFHNGCLKVATMSNSPVVVTTIQGTEKIRKNAPWKSSTVTIDVLRVISPEEYENTVELSNLIRETMLSNLKFTDNSDNSVESKKENDTV